MTLNPFVPESREPRTNVAGNRYSPPRSTTVMSRVIELFMVRTTSRAFSMVRNGCVRVPGLLSLPVGETYNVAPEGEGGDTITVTGTRTSATPLALKVRTDRCVPTGSPGIPDEGVRIVDEPEEHVPNAHPGVAS
jgi:hypothetical protein